MEPNPVPGPNGPDDAVSATFDWSSVRPSAAVVEVYAVATNQNPSVLDPLFEFIDPDALDTLVRSSVSASADDVTVSFTVADRRVTVDSSGLVVVGKETTQV
ncbi:HalOD1 output domain-containing protein [Haloferax sp. YSMS24]|uniref:HalOD1 output domain-containing protein n=1 Tax=unclassified Haloferax TaxID=2625095 RepID=UPI00398C9E2C